MPTCRDMSELVTDYLERATPLRLQGAMRWHLFRCEACRRYFDQVRRTMRLLGSLPPVPPGNAAEDRVLDAARQRIPRSE